MKNIIGDVDVSMDGHVAIVEIQRPPNNFFDHTLICDLADAFDQLDDETNCRSIVLAAEGKHFCAGANFAARAEGTTENDPGALYREAVRMFSNKKPVVGAIQGAAIGGGLGLSLVPDFRVVCAETRFAANFVKLGFHPGFGLTHTLPRLIGQQNANLMFFTGRRVGGEEALKWGMADILTTLGSIRDAALALAHEIAENAPLGVMATRATVRQGLAQAVDKATDHELIEQDRLRQTEDHKEGVRAVAERRVGNFFGR